jgi:hypothetical protein
LLHIHDQKATHENVAEVFWTYKRRQRRSKLRAKNPYNVDDELQNAQDVLLSESTPLRSTYFQKI